MVYQYRPETEFQQGAPLPGAGRAPVVTWTLLAVNALVWMAMEVVGGSEDPEVLLDFGALFGPSIANGEYWRLFTAMFLHIGLMHLLFNGFGLFIFGRMVERVYGRTRFAAIYLLAGLAGSVVSFLLNPISIGAGASGAIFGILGALVAYFVAGRDVLGEMGRQTRSGLVVIAVINLMFGYLTPGIDNWAHLGGLIGGFAVAYPLAPTFRRQGSTDPIQIPTRPVKTNSLVRRWWVLPLALLVLAAGTRMGMATVGDHPIFHVQKAERFLEEQSYDSALQEIAEAIQLDPLIGEAYYVRGRVLADIGDVGGAVSDLALAIRLGLDPETRAQAITLLLALRSRP